MLQQSNQHSAAPKGSATLSVVLLSLGSRADLDRAIDALTPGLRRYAAQLVIARADDGQATLSGLNDQPACTIVRAPVGSGRTELCDLGMAAATGDIVALREDSSVRDWSWMESFSTSVRPIAPSETLVADWERPTLGAAVDLVGNTEADRAKGERPTDGKTVLSIPSIDRRTELRRAASMD